MTNLVSSPPLTVSFPVNIVKLALLLARAALLRRLRRYNVPTVRASAVSTIAVTMATLEFADRCVDGERIEWSAMDFGMGVVEVVSDD